MYCYLYNTAKNALYVYLLQNYSSTIVDLLCKMFIYCPFPQNIITLMSVGSESLAVTSILSLHLRAGACCTVQCVMTDYSPQYHCPLL